MDSHHAAARRTHRSCCPAGCSGLTSVCRLLLHPLRISLHVALTAASHCKAAVPHDVVLSWLDSLVCNAVRSGNFVSCWAQLLQFWRALGLYVLPTTVCLTVQLGAAVTWHRRAARDPRHAAAIAARGRFVLLHGAAGRAWPLTLRLLHTFLAPSAATPPRARAARLASSPRDRCRASRASAHVCRSLT